MHKRYRGGGTDSLGRGEADYGDANLGRQFVPRPELSAADSK
jgi:hypothetical protein